MKYKLISKPGTNGPIDPDWDSIKERISLGKYTQWWYDDVSIGEVYDLDILGGTSDYMYLIEDMNLLITENELKSYFKPLREINLQDIGV